MKALLLLIHFLAATALMAAEPNRDAGLSIHMLPERIAKISGGHGGFSVTDPATKAAGATYADGNELLTWFQHLPKPTQENGMWIVLTNPSSYADAEQAKLKALVALCHAKNIPVFTCRGSELPDGWVRAE